MAQKVADPCRNCGAALPPGAPFCTLCGTAAKNLAAAPAPGSVPLGGPAAGSVPGIIEVGATPGGPLLPPVGHGVDQRFAAAAALVPGGAGRRLAAKLLDGVVPALLLGLGAGIGATQISVTQIGSYAQLNLGNMWLFIAIAGVLSLAYSVFLWIWEARTGKTPGNLMVGLRTTNMDGGPAGILAIFLRNLIIGLGSIIPGVGQLLVIISNAWDANGKKQGWHDKVAHTLVFNIKDGRNPLETGGIAGRAAFVPAPVPTISAVGSPLMRPDSPALTPLEFADQPQAPAQGSTFAPPSSAIPAGWAPPAFAPAAQPPATPGPITSVPGSLRNTLPEPPNQQPPAHQPPNHQQPVQQPAPAVAPPAQSAAAPSAGLLAEADDEAGETRIRPVAPSAGLRLTFDDGRIEDVASVALIGRNPAGYDGEMISRLISVQDSARSVSKSHLHLRVAAEGLWVTDRNSTNGSALTRPQGPKVTLAAGVPTVAALGDRVHFGDRSFVVGPL